MEKAVSENHNRSLDWWIIVLTLASAALLAVLLHNTPPASQQPTAIETAKTSAATPVKHPAADPAEPLSLESQQKILKIISGE